MPDHINEGHHPIFSTISRIPRLWTQLSAPLVKSRPSRRFVLAENLPLPSAAAKIARYGVRLLQENKMFAWFVPPVVVPALLVIAIAITALLQ